MKAISVCLLALMVATAAAARPGPTARALRADSNEENKQGSSGSFLLPMPAIYIPEFGKEMTFNDMPKFPKLPEMPSITAPTIDWDKLKPSSDNSQTVSVPDANSQEVNTQSSQDSTTDNNHKEDESDNPNKSDNSGKTEKLGAGNSTPATKQQESQQPTAAPSTAGNQDDCSKTDTSAQSVMRCVNAVRTNPQAFKSDFPCSSPWLNTISRSQRSALTANSKLDSSAQRQANDMARNSRIAHVGSDGSTVGQRIRDAGYTTFPQAENIAVGQTSAHQVTMEWMCSEGHRHAIMNCEYDEVGTAVAQNRGTWYYAQNFGCSSGRCPTCEVA